MPRLTKENQATMQAHHDDAFVPILEKTIQLKKEFFRIIEAEKGTEVAQNFMKDMDKNFHIYNTFSQMTMSSLFAPIDKDGSLTTIRTAVFSPAQLSPPIPDLDLGILWIFEMQYYAYSLNDAGLRARFLSELGLPLPEPSRRNPPRKHMLEKPKV